MEQNDLERFYVDAVRFFKDLGFFARHSGLSDEELALRVKGDVCMQWDEPFPSRAEKDPQLADMYLLSTDRERAWFADLECVYPGADAYTRFLDGMAAISRGSFKPRDVIERWKGERGPIEVSFTVGGKRWAFMHKGGDMLDPSILRVVNGAIEDTGMVFATCDNFGMPNFILALNRDEMTRLAVRGWQFWRGV